MKQQLFLLTFSHQNPQSHYVYCSLCSSFFVKRSFDRQLLGSYFNLIYLLFNRFYFVSSLNRFYVMEENVPFLLPFRIFLSFVCLRIFFLQILLFLWKKVPYVRDQLAGELKVFLSEERVEKISLNMAECSRPFMPLTCVSGIQCVWSLESFIGTVSLLEGRHICLIITSMNEYLP